MTTKVGEREKEACIVPRRIENMFDVVFAHTDNRGGMPDLWANMRSSKFYYFYLRILRQQKIQQAINRVACSLGTLGIRRFHQFSRGKVTIPPVQVVCRSRPVFRGTVTRAERRERESGGFEVFRAESPPCVRPPFFVFVLDV